MLTPCTPRRYICGGELKIYFHSFLASILAIGRWSDSRSICFILVGTYWICGWVTPRNSLDVFEERKISCLRRELNLDSSVIHLVVYSLTIISTIYHFLGVLLSWMLKKECVILWPGFTSTGQDPTRRRQLHFILRKDS